MIHLSLKRDNRPERKRREPLPNGISFPHYTLGDRNSSTSSETCNSRTRIVHNIHCVKGSEPNNAATYGYRLWKTSRIFKTVYRGCVHPDGSVCWSSDASRGSFGCLVRPGRWYAAPGGHSAELVTSLVKTGAWPRRLTVIPG
ncbi:hypothetical protein E2C01_033265 [Portunus trituberculatus]|uniref:Uncharacterized protein n=1 Tax=Portunus trituberculatus TaxID=210409 RepID=A0A5B7F3K1_PORTR|nr:hypothetical protein [Portunus trituberculatus]